MIDFNTKLGHFPYRPVEGIEDLLRAMDAHGVERAVVSSLNAIFYFNPQDGNEDLAKLIAPHRERFIPFAVLKPTFSGWRHDLARCVDELGMAGLVLHPSHHQYDPAGEDTAALMAAAEGRGLPVCVQAWVEDPRRQFDRAIIDPLPVEPIVELARTHLRVPVVGLGLRIGQPEQVGDTLPDNFYFDTSNYEHMNGMEKALEQFEQERILFGTNFPLYNYRANVDKIALADIPDVAKTAITTENARRVLGV